MSILADAIFSSIDNNRRLISSVLFLPPLKRSSIQQQGLGGAFHGCLWPGRPQSSPHGRPLKGPESSNKSPHPRKNAFSLPG